MALRTLQLILFVIGFIFFALGAGGLAAGPGPGGSPGETRVAAKTIEEVLSQHAGNLLAVPGVVGVAQGQCGDRPCLRVYVIQKTPELEQKIPAHLEGYPVVIEATGKIRPMPEKSRKGQDR